MTAESRAPAGGCAAAFRTGLAEAVLGEIAQLLARLAATEEEGAIDLRSLPMTDGDRAELEQRLGRGEVEARLALAGASEVWETAYAGVWWIRHRGAGEAIAAETIAVTRMPEILMTHPADLREAARRLGETLAQGAGTGEAEERHG